MLFQCSARLTLIWLSGSALLPCQAVWAVVKLFEGGLSRGVACLCQDETRLRGCKTSVCSQTPSLSLFCTPAVFFLICSLHLLPQSQPFSFSLSPVSLPFSSSVSRLLRDKHKHICTHFLLFLSEVSLKEL